MRLTLYGVSILLISRLPGFIFRGQILAIGLTAGLFAVILMREWMTHHNWHRHEPPLKEKETFDVDEWIVLLGRARKLDHPGINDLAVNNEPQSSPEKREGKEPPLVAILKKYGSRLYSLEIDTYVRHLFFAIQRVNEEREKLLAKPSTSARAAARLRENEQREDRLCHELADRLEILTLRGDGTSDPGSKASFEQANGQASYHFKLVDDLRRLAFAWNSALFTADVPYHEDMDTLEKPLREKTSSDLGASSVAPTENHGASSRVDRDFDLKEILGEDPETFSESIAGVDHNASSSPHLGTASQDTNGLSADEPLPEAVAAPDPMPPPPEIEGAEPDTPTPDDDDEDIRAGEVEVDQLEDQDEDDEADVEIADGDDGVDFADQDGGGWDGDEMDNIFEREWHCSGFG